MHHLPDGVDSVILLSIGRIYRHLTAFRNRQPGLRSRAQAA